MRNHKLRVDKRIAAGLTARGTPRIYKKLPKPGHEKVSSIADEIVEILHATYQWIPDGYQLRFRAMARKLAAVKRHNPGKKVRVA